MSCINGKIVVPPFFKQTGGVRVSQHAGLFGMFYPSPTEGCWKKVKITNKGKWSMNERWLAQDES